MSVYDLNRILTPQAPTGSADDTGDLHFVPAPCQAACPVGTDAPSYIGYIWEGKFKQAFEAITATNPFSSICGRVCDAPCEPACRRTDSDGPVMIRNLKRFVMEEVGDSYDAAPVPVTQKQTIGIVGAGPAGLVAAHDLSVAGYEVHVYEMTDRLGGMMVWGIPAFRLPPGTIQEDIVRLEKRCPGLKMHYNCALGTDVTLADLKSRHDAVLLTIGAWWGKSMQIPGEQDDRVVDGVGFLRRVNDGERPELPDTVVVVGGGDVAMDACRAALRLPGCKHVKVVYRRGPEEIPARVIELEGAVKEGIEFIYNTQQVSVGNDGNGLRLTCVKTEAGAPDEDGRRRPVVVSDSEHDIACGMVIAAVGQQTESAELEQLGLMNKDRVATKFEGMRTGDSNVFAAGDGAFGGSTIVMAMGHGQRAAYYIKAFLDGVESPLPYRTPHRTRRVPVAQDIMWERFPPQEPEFYGVGANPVEFPEIESTYTAEMAKAEAARCYRCDAETGSADYSVHHREDLFSMARTMPGDHNKLKAMLALRMESRDDPFPDGRDATLDDLVFLPANLSRLVIDPYREACKVSFDLAGKLDLQHPYMVTGFDDAPEQVKKPVAQGLGAANAAYVGRVSIGDECAWLQVVGPESTEADARATGVLVHVGESFVAPRVTRHHDSQLLGLTIASSAVLNETIDYALANEFDVLLLDGCGGLGSLSAELSGAPNLGILRDAIKRLRALKREETIDLLYFGGVRSGTDAAKIIGLGANIIVLGVPVALSVGGSINESGRLTYASDYSDQDRAGAVSNLIQASIGEASMMARCTGKTNLHNLEPEDIRSITLASAQAAGIPLVGSH